jgi:hypothetical protein
VAAGRITQPGGLDAIGLEYRMKGYLKEESVSFKALLTLPIYINGKYKH